MAQNRVALILLLYYDEGSEIFLAIHAFPP